MLLALFIICGIVLVAAIVYTVYYFVIAKPINNEMETEIESYELEAYHNASKKNADKPGK